MSSIYSLFLDKLKMFILPYGTLAQAEARGSGGESFLPTNLRVSWVDLFGSPYYQTIPTGGETLALGGLADIAGNAKIHVQCIIQGSAGATGNVVIKFAVANDPSGLGSSFVDTSLNITIASSGANVVTSDSQLSVGAWRYIKVYSVTHSIGTNCNVQVRIYGAAQPMKL